MEETVHAPRFFAVHVRGRIEVLDFAADFDVEVARLEPLHEGDARAAVDDRVPGRGHVQADGCDGPHAGNHDAARAFALDESHFSRRSIAPCFARPIVSGERRRVSFAHADLALWYGEC